jgi:phosphatidylglycerol---prolipoprotein diacylglyceryl transferase
MLPILFQNSEFILYSYPLLMGIGWGVAYQIYFSEQFPGASRLKALILFWGVFISAWLGAKLLFLITYPEDLQENIILNPSFWTGGGFVFYGGLLGALVFLLIFKLIDHSLNFRTLWPMVPALAFGHSIGRIGCFLAGCCFGKPTELFWGVYMHQHDRHPTQLLEAIGLFAIGLYLLKSKTSKFLLFSYYLISYGLLRFGVEMLRGDLVRGHWGSLTPSQWISLVLIFSGLGLRFLPKFKDLRTP